MGSFRLHVLRDVSGERAAQHAAHQASLLDIPTPPVPPQISMEEVLRGRQTTPAEAPKKEAPLEEDEVRPDEGLDFVVAPRVSDFKDTVSFGHSVHCGQFVPERSA